MTYRPCETDTDDDIERIFQNFDEEGKGYISE
jgi:Ca2+-binding EF-hand superfamily protein